MIRPQQVNLRTWFRYTIFGLIILPVAIVMVAYFTLPYLLPSCLSSYLQTQGVERSGFVFSRPGLEHMTVDLVDLTMDGVKIQANDIHLRYHFAGLLEQRIDEVVIGMLSITLPASDSPANTNAVPSPWTDIPVDELFVTRFELNTVTPAAKVSGRASINQTIANARFELSSDLLPSEMDIDVELQRTGELALEVGFVDSVTVLSILGRYNGQGQVKFDGDLQLTDAAFELALQLAGIGQPEGYIKGSFSGSSPWPFQHFESVSGSGDFDIEFEGDIGEALGVAYKGPVGLYLEPGLLRFESAGSTIGLQNFKTPDHEYIFQDSLIDLAYRARLPLVANRTDFSQMTGEADLNIAINLPGETRAGADFTLADTTINGALTASLTESQHRLSGQLGVSAGQFDYHDTRYQIDGIPVKLDIDLQAPGNAMLSSTTRITGTLEADIVTSITSNATDAPLSHLQLDAGVRMSLRDDRYMINIAPNSLANIRVEERDFGVENLNATTMNVGYDGVISSVDARLSSRFEFATEDQRLKYTQARIYVEALTVTGDDIQASGSFRSDRSNQALPVAFMVNAKRTSGKGVFEISANHVIKRPVLAKELPGWVADYDLLSGQFNMKLKGNFDLSGEPRFDATGELDLKEGVARYEDLPLTGVTAQLPIKFNNENFFIGPGPIAIDLIDVGFPVNAMAFQFETDAVLARVNDFSASLLAADINIAEMVYHLDNEASQFAVAINGLPVANVLALEGEDIHGDGILDGRLPVVLNRTGASISGGSFAARQPGGYLRYQGDLPATNPGLELAIRALRNFEYSEMIVGVDYEPDGALAALIRLRGKSPDVENGRAIHFNMNVSENIPALLESIRASEATQKRVQQRLSR